MPFLAHVLRQFFIVGLSPRCEALLFSYVAQL
jgi:hypothetical protein